MKKKILIALSIYFLTLLSIHAQEWKLAKIVDSIQVYTRSVEGTSVKSYKALASINAPIDAVSFLFTDLDSYKEMMKDMGELELLQNTNNGKYVFYSKMGMPWPVKDRDVVTETIIEKGSDGIITIKTNTLENWVEPKDGFVRIVNYWEVLTLTPDGKEKVEIHIEGLFDMGGSLPPWIINMFLVDGTIDIIKNIREQVE